MKNRRVRLSIKLSSFTVSMVVVSMMAAYYVTRNLEQWQITAWVFIFSAISLMVGLFYTLFLDRNITVPLQTLVDYTSRMVAKDFQEPVPIETNDEIGTLAAAIEEMRRNLLEQRRSLQELNEHLDAMVESRTQELQEALQNLEKTQAELIKAEKLASIGRLAGGIAHEINNPSGIILTRTGLLLETAQEAGLPPEHIEALQVIDRQVKRIARITGDLLVFSRMTPMETRPVNVSRLLQWMCTTYGTKAKACGVEIQGEIPPGVMALGDPGGLEQVFGNVIKNALDAMEDTGGRLDIRLTLHRKQVAVHIEDTGPGIPEDVLPRLFDPFFTTKKVGKGTGLGLAISYGILQELQGRITAKNRNAGGASFTITLVAAHEPQQRSAIARTGQEGGVS